MIQQAILQVLQPRFDPDFSEHSFGFRPSRSAHDAVREAWEYIQEGRRWVVDIIQALVQQPDYQAARKYWNKLKELLNKEGSESVANCHQLKLEVADGKKYLTDVADVETLLRCWLAKVGHERI